MLTEKELNDKVRIIEHLESSGHYFTINISTRPNPVVIGYSLGIKSIRSLLWLHGFNAQFVTYIVARIEYLREQAEQEQP